MTDIVDNTGMSIVEKFRVKIDEMADTPARTSMRQAADSFARFLGSAQSDGPLDEALAGEWAAWMLAGGYTLKTAAYYLGRLSSLYNKVSGKGGSNCFASAREKLNGASASSVEVGSVGDCYGKLRSLALSDHSSSPERQLGRDLVLFSLYNGGIPFGELPKCLKDGWQDIGGPAGSIARRYAKARNKYLFPLRQSELTPRQQSRLVAGLCSDALRSAGIRLSEIAPSTAADLWAVAALRCGFPASDIAGCLGASAAGNPLLALAPSAVLDGDRKAEIRARVAAVLSKDPEDWYAMQFRPRVDYAKVQGRLEACGLSLPASFYPMEEIARRVGKKIKREQKPVVPGLLFFKSRASSLPGLFAQIGDLAWGYRQSRAPRSPYAVIPQAAIEAYQRAIGQFADAVDAHPRGTLRFEPGDPVEILAGDYAGHPAVFEKEVREASGGQTRLTARLRLTGLPSLTWTVDLDPRLLTPAHKYTYA